MPDLAIGIVQKLMCTILAKSINSYWSWCHKGRPSGAQQIKTKFIRFCIAQPELFILQDGKQELKAANISQFSLCCGSIEEFNKLVGNAKWKSAWGFQKYYLYLLLLFGLAQPSKSATAKKEAQNRNRYLTIFYNFRYDSVRFHFRCRFATIAAAAGVAAAAAAATTRITWQDLFARHNYKLSCWALQFEVLLCVSSFCLLFRTPHAKFAKRNKKKHSGK